MCVTSLTVNVVLTISIGELKRGLARTARTARTARIDWDTDSTEFDGTASCDNKNKVNMVTQIST